MSEKTGLLAVAGGEIAWRRIAGARPTVVWLGGLRSDMSGTKAQALADWAEARGRGCLRFDYQGHGGSSGDFVDGTIGRWKGDALAAIDRLTEGPLVLVGSSLGGWLACLAALARPERAAGLVLIAPAADFTEALMRPSLPDEALEAIARDGVWLEPNAYDGEDPLPITQALLDEGRDHLILTGEEIGIDCPVRVLQGGEDPDVPWDHALALAGSLRSRDTVFTLIRDGDHRLSRPQDLARMLAAVAELAMAARPSANDG